MSRRSIRLKIQIYWECIISWTRSSSKLRCWRPYKHTAKQASLRNSTPSTLNQQKSKCSCKFETAQYLKYPIEKVGSRWANHIVSRATGVKVTENTASCTTSSSDLVRVKILRGLNLKAIRIDASITKGHDHSLYLPGTLFFPTCNGRKVIQSSRQS